MKTEQNRASAKPEAAPKAKSTTVPILSKRVDFARKVEDVLVASSILGDDEALEAFEKTRTELLSELDAKERSELERMKKNASDIVALQLKISAMEKEQSAMAPGGEDEDWDDMANFDYETLNSEEYETLTENIEAGHERLESLERKRAEFERKGEWRTKACYALEKAGEKFRRKYAQIRDYETFWEEALPKELQDILQNNAYRAVKTAFSVTFVLKTTNGIRKDCLWGHYRDTPFSWAAFHSKKNAPGWTRETFRHESRHNAYEAIFDESEFWSDMETLWSRLQSLEKLSKSWLPDPMRKQRHSHLVRSIRSMAKTFSEKFLSHNRDEVLANFGPLLSFQSSTEVMNANDIHEGLRGIVEMMGDESQAQKEAQNVLERFEEEIESYFDRLSDFLFVARIGGKPQTAKMLLYVTEPYELDLAEAHLENMVSVRAYDSFSKLRRMLYPEGISHSVPRKAKSWLKEKDFKGLIEYFENTAWDTKKRFKDHPALLKIAEKLERAYFDGDGKGVEELTPEEELLKTIFWRRSENVREEALKLARLIRSYVGEYDEA